jgi:3-hydroxyisobutyrate dehydrogenase-like beta-hydroxyacid dehydrogenase
MAKKKLKIAILGLGEAGSSFANDLSEMGVSVVGYDPVLLRVLHPNVRLAASNPAAAAEADIILSVNLAAVGEQVATEVLPVLRKGQIFAEMNTASPQTKKNVEEIINQSGAQTVDVAIMAPVPQKGVKTPFLISGPGALKFEETLVPFGLDIIIINGQVGEAATRKLLRSVVYKGFAAVIGEAVAAGEALGLEHYIREQIGSLIGGDNAIIDRFLEGSKTHALRRSHELDAVVAMLTDLKLDPVMSKATLKSLQNLIVQNQIQ